VPIARHGASDRHQGCDWRDLLTAEELNMNDVVQAQQYADQGRRHPSPNHEVNIYWLVALDDELKQLSKVIARCYMRLQAADVPRAPWHWEVSTALDNTGLCSLVETPAPTDKPGHTFDVTDHALRALWRAHGGDFHGPNVETGTMPEATLLPFLRSLALDTQLAGSKTPSRESEEPRTQRTASSEADIRL
jgi:hypothetical protein